MYKKKRFFSFLIHNNKNPKEKKFYEGELKLKKT